MNLIIGVQSPHRVLLPFFIDHGYHYSIVVVVVVVVIASISFAG